ncbi:hypothetical protein BDF22DRAFT_60102 [Syncephalis plumigaleata]|nr:hypothetical protein BDF22DRAFT_60102 [Syncephalis plumigaleata]
MAASSNTESKHLLVYYKLQIFINHYCTLRWKGDVPRAISPIRAASPSPASPTAPSIPSPLSPFRFRSSSTGGNDVVPASAARRIQELETEVTRINASYQHLLVQFETICQSNSNLQLASAQNEYQKHAQSNHARSNSVTSTSYASSEQSMDVTDREYDNESIVDDDDEEEDEEEEDEEETGISESEYGEETESEAETISSIGDRSESSACQGTPVIRPSNPRHSITSVNGDETFTGMTSFQQQVEPVIEEYEKVVAGLEAQLAETSEAIQEAEKQLQLYKERALQAEEIQQANNHELMELRAQLQQLEQAHMMYQEQAADVECAQSEIERLQRRVEDLEAQLEEEREATTAAIAAASEAASRLRTPDLRQIILPLIAIVVVPHPY